VEEDSPLHRQSSLVNVLTWVVGELQTRSLNLAATAQESALTTGHAGVLQV